MKFNIRSNDLVSAVSKVISVTPTRSTLPILGNLYFDLKNGELSILGTDLEVYVYVKLNVDGKQDGRITIPAKRFYDIIQNLSDRDLSFESAANFRFIMKTKGGRWTVTGEDPNDYPMPAEIEGAKRIELEQKILMRYLSKAIHAASTDELRRSMNGILFELSQNQLKVVSTDGHRLVQITKSDFDYNADTTSILIPVKTCSLMLKLFKSDSDSAIGMDVSNEMLKCSFDNVTIVTRLIEDTFPNYQSVIPTDNDKKLKVNKESVSSAVKRSIIMSDQITNRTSFVVSENEVKVKSANNEFGTDSEETLDCSFTESEEFEIAFNGRYLLDALQNFDSKEVLFDFSTPLRATILTPSEQETGENMMMLIMPVRNI
jgi:DNA polymerase-3 subunit beta